MRAIQILLFILLPIFCFSQNLDSLKSVVNNTPKDLQFEVVLSYMRSLLGESVVQSYNVSEYAVEYAEKIGDSLLITKALYAQSFLLRRMNKENQAVANLKKIYGIAKRNNYYEELSKILNLLAVSYTYTANYDEALKTNFEALTVNEKRNNLEDISISCNNIGLVYFKLRNYDESLKFYQKSLMAKKKSGSTFDLDRLHINMALCFNQLNAFIEAEQSILEAFKACGDNCSDEIVMEAELALGVSLMNSERSGVAIDHFNKSLALSRKLKSTRFEMEILSLLAKTYLQEGDDEKALELLRTAEVISKSTEYLQSLLYLYEKFSDYYAETNDYQNAAYYSRKYSSLRDSVLSESLIKNLANVQSQFAERENLATISIKDQTIKQQRYISSLIALTFILSGLLILFIMRTNRIARKLNSKLSEEVQRQTAELTVAKQKLEKSNKSLMYVNAELDNLIYKTSHDLKGPLTTLKGICNLALMDVKDATALDYFAKIDQTTAKLSKVLDRLSVISVIMSTEHQIVPINLPVVINEIVQHEKRIAKQKDIKIDLFLKDIPGFVTDPKLLRYALESVISNAFKYHNDSPRVDSYISITVKLKRERVIISIIDNGIGMGVDDKADVFRLFFRASERSETGGTGLFIAKLATEKLSGDIEFYKLPNATEFRITLPKVFEMTQEHYDEIELNKHVMAPKIKAP
ncbi:ATP-binding protein [Chryseotalea sanaruensis]|uniref:histidine kinase n=2 Tax=Chryseotalea sanaruensis TaxID=2482724 RepID=A0A401UEP0_9BACT|nr:ATP-binding protein [Chryseotalea sanaruensis]